MKCRFLIDERCLCGVAKSFETNPTDETCRSCENYEGIPRGAGDVVHEIAKAIRITDAAKKLFGTCGGCAHRRALLNEALPFPDREKKDGI